MRAPDVTPATASEMLRLIDHALGTVPRKHALDYLRGWLTARAGERVASEPPAPRDTIKTASGRGSSVVAACSLTALVLAMLVGCGGAVALDPEPSPVPTLAYSAAPDAGTGAPCDGGELLGAAPLAACTVEAWACPGGDDFVARRGGDALQLGPVVEAARVAAFCAEADR